MIPSNSFKDTPSEKWSTQTGSRSDLQLISGTGTREHSPPKISPLNKISPENKGSALPSIQHRPTETMYDGQRFIQETGGVQVHVETIRRNLRGERIRARVQQRRLDLQPNPCVGSACICPVTHRLDSG